MADSHYRLHLACRMLDMVDMVDIISYIMLDMTATLCGGMAQSCSYGTSTAAGAYTVDYKVREGNHYSEAEQYW